MGFYIGILIKSSLPKGRVHKLMILLRDLPKEILRKFFGEEVGGSGGPRPPSEISDLIGTCMNSYENLRKAMIKQGKPKTRPRTTKEKQCNSLEILWSDGKSMDILHKTKNIK